MYIQYRKPELCVLKRKVEQQRHLQWRGFMPGSHPFMPTRLQSVTIYKMKEDMHETTIVIIISSVMHFSFSSEV